MVTHTAHVVYYYELERDSTPVFHRGVGCTEAIDFAPARHNDLTDFAAAARRPNSRLPHIGFEFLATNNTRFTTTRSSVFNPLAHHRAPSYQIHAYGDPR